MSKAQPQPKTNKPAPTSVIINNGGMRLLERIFNIKGIFTDFNDIAAAGDLLDGPLLNQPDLPVVKARDAVAYTLAQRAWDRTGSHDITHTKRQADVITKGLSNAAKEHHLAAGPALLGLVTPFNLCDITPSAKEHAVTLNNGGMYQLALILGIQGILDTVEDIAFAKHAGVFLRLEFGFHLFLESSTFPGHRR